MKKSKTLYIAVLVGLLNIALIDHLKPNQANQQIAVGESDSQLNDHFEYALLTE